MSTVEHLCLSLCDRVENTNEADIPFQLSGSNKDRLEVKGGVPLDHELKNQVSMIISSTD